MKKTPPYFKTSVAKRLKKPIAPTALQTLLFAVFSHSPPMKHLRQLTPTQRAIVEDYACRVHLNASDNKNVRVPKAPAFINLHEPTVAAYVDGNGRFHCKCGAQHSRGPVNGADAYRCLNCGETSNVNRPQSGTLHDLVQKPEATGQDPTYKRSEIDAKPVWKIAFILSECLNDGAPLGWGKYIWVAEAICKYLPVNTTPQSVPQGITQHLPPGTKVVAKKDIHVGRRVMRMGATGRIRARLAYAVDVLEDGKIRPMEIAQSLINDLLVVETTTKQ